jgi:hypothetical protein
MNSAKVPYFEGCITKNSSGMNTSTKKAPFPATMEPCNFGFAFIHFCALYVSPSGQQKVA